MFGGKKRKRDYFPIFLLLPCFSIVFGLLIIPLSYTIGLSFGTIEGIEYSFVGLENYFSLLNDSKLWNEVLGNTFYFAAGFMVPSTLLALGIALLFNQDFLGVKIFRTLLLVPYAVSPIANAVIWKWMYSSKFGIINYALYSIGIIGEYKAWLTDPSLAMLSVITAQLWKTAPFFAILILARLQTISKDLYEAANIDGANKFRRFIHVTLPSIKLTMVIVLIIEVMWSFRIFAIIQALTQGGPMDRTLVLVYYTYKVGFRYMEFGYASTLAILNALIIGVIVLAYLKLIPK